MKVIGITGGVGAGKSEVLSHLKEAYGAEILLADNVGHLVMKKGAPCFEAIADLFGEQVIGEDGELNRAAIAAIVFADKDKLRKLEEIVHPAVRTYIVDYIAKADKEGANLLFLESAILLEEKYDEICDEIWYVYADEAVRTARLKVARGYSEEKIRGIMRNQLPEETFRKRCSFVLDNSGSIANMREQIAKELNT